jgi:hypothetical protein
MKTAKIDLLPKASTTYRTAKLIPPADAATLSFLLNVSLGVALTEFIDG